MRAGRGTGTSRPVAAQERRLAKTDGCAVRRGALGAGRDIKTPPPGHEARYVVGDNEATA